MAEFLFTPTPNKEAAAFIQAKPLVARAVFNKLLPELKARAFTIAGVEAAGVLQRARDALATLPQGGDWNEIKRGLLTELSPYFIDPAADADEQAAQQRAADRRAELLLRTHGQQAYAVTQEAMLGAQTDLFPFWEYLTLGDGHVRPTHQALDGVVLPANHEFWKTHTPPWGWGCRCQKVGRTREDVERQRANEQAKPADQRGVLDDYAQQDLTTNRRLVRNGVTYHLRTPYEEGKPGAYHFDPSDLRLSPDVLRERYDAQTWNDFAQWAGGTHPFPDHPLTIWDWLSGQPVPAYETAPDEPASPLPRRPTAQAYRADERTALRAGAAVGRTLYPRDAAPGYGAHSRDIFRAEIGAVGAGRKPLYHEQLADAEEAALAALALQQRLPAGVEALARGAHLIVFRPEIVRPLLDADPAFYRPAGEDDMEAIWRSTLAGEQGELMGYGARTLFGPGRVRVYFSTADGRLLAGFSAPAERAMELARERGQDYGRALGFPVFFHIR